MGSALFSSPSHWNLLLSVLHDLLPEYIQQSDHETVAFFVLLHIFAWDIHVLLPILSARQRYLTFDLHVFPYLAALIYVCLD